MTPALTEAQTRRLEQAITRHIRRYSRCRQRLGDIDAVTYALGLNCFGTELALICWLCAPAPALNGRLPFQQLGTARGRATVNNLLLAIQHGVYL